MPDSDSNKVPPEETEMVSDGTPPLHAEVSFHPTQPETAESAADRTIPPKNDSTNTPGEVAAPPPAVHASDEYRCHTCGYSLRGLAATGACPECQTAYDPLPALIPPGYVCYRCSYSLAGMPTDGGCPECGTQYSFAHAFRGMPYPGQWPLVFRLGWPAILAVGAMAFMIIVAFSRRGAEELWCLVIILYLANLVNLPIATSSVIKNYVPPSKRKGYFAALLSLGRWVFASWLLSLLFLGGPVAVIGIVVFGKMLFR